MIDIEKMKALAAELRDPAQKWANLASDANRAANAIDTLLSELEAREADRRDASKLTKQQAIIITGFTGVLCCDFGDFHTDVERRKGRGVWTHEFASNKDELKELYRDDFMSILHGDALAQRQGEGHV
ncbi:hypothetical protein KDW20_12045 [Burkholderia cenocepacia]|uniref:DUF7736 domain-containing protein n=1 Tax=Burkholderia cenocepacia TaxID=95486 RepID=UPI001BA21D86|nr:hypothetical protein [Burkholderia cenocepacia]MBR8376509.1 hypothetical protein [Burkholderia cenocepacia]